MHHSVIGIPIGRVVGLWRYPVKSMAGEPLTSADVSWFGFCGDRRWAFVRDGVPESGFPWLTLRERENMNHYKPSFIEPDRPDKSPVAVLTPSGASLRVSDPALAKELAPGARAIKQDRGVFDTFPLSLISTQTIASLSKRVGEPLAVERFRPNILVEANGDSPFPEDDWVGHVLCIGELRVRIDKRDGRCAIITIDPISTNRSPNILRTVVQERQGCLGVYGTTVQPGRIAANDTVSLEPQA
jgi:uncharacterized protein YcbX